MCECSKLKETKETWQLSDGLLSPKMKEREAEGKGEKEGRKYEKDIWGETHEI